MDMVYARFDTSGDGTITYHEFARFVRERGAAAEAPLRGGQGCRGVRGASAEECEMAEQELIDGGARPTGYEAAVNALLQTMDAGAKHHHDGSTDWQRSFIKMDRDASGAVTMSELDRALRELGVTRDPAVIHCISVRLDANLDGFVRLFVLPVFRAALRRLITIDDK